MRKNNRLSYGPPTPTPTVPLRAFPDVWQFAFWSDTQSPLIYISSLHRIILPCPQILIKDTKTVIMFYQKIQHLKDAQDNKHVWMLRIWQIVLVSKFVATQTVSQPSFLTLLPWLSTYWTVSTIHLVLKVSFHLIMKKTKWSSRK